MIGHEVSKETKKKIGVGNTGKVRSEEFKANVRKDVIKRWQDPEYKNRVVQATLRATTYTKPNKLESEFAIWLDKYWVGKWKYVGNGQLIIGGKCPDFVHINKPLLLEIFGDYWHKDEDTFDRMSHFSQYGYDTKIVWESVFKNDPRWIQRMIESWK